MVLIEHLLGALYVQVVLRALCPGQFNKPVEEVNKKLLDYEIFGGKDLTKEYPELGDSALYCVTEMHTLGMIEKLDAALKEVLA